MAIDKGKVSSSQMGSRWFVIAAVVFVGILAGVLLWILGSLGVNTVLQLLLAFLPGSIIVTQLVYLASSRRKQYRDALALAPLDETEVNRLEDLYFGLIPLTFRYGAPAVLVTVLCATTIAALVDPEPYFPWLFKPVSGAAPSPNQSGTNRAGADQKGPAPGADQKGPDTSSMTPPYWPSGGWAQVYNHANFAIPNAVVFQGTNYSSSAGIITGTATTSRQIQFALKLLW